MRYYIDSNLEDNVGSTNESSKGKIEVYDEDEDESDTREYLEQVKTRKLIPITDDEIVSRFALCLHCRVGFDVTSNNRGDYK